LGSLDRPPFFSSPAAGSSGTISLPCTQTERAAPVREPLSCPPDSPVTPEDNEAIREVNRHAFGREDEARLVDALRDGGYARGRQVSRGRLARPRADGGGAGGPLVPVW
jgi:hypothetical protein